MRKPTQQRPEHFGVLYISTATGEATGPASVLRNGMSAKTQPAGKGTESFGNKNDGHMPKQNTERSFLHLERIL